tara:strand:+ start:61677 stop:62228 length:552 start_codon:yes stop_codon:yes gene_type:complete
MEIKNIAKGGRIRPIIRMGNPLLTKISDDINPESKETMSIIKDMAATIIDVGQIAGLAATQIGYLKKIIYYQVVASRGDSYNPEGVKPVFLINPTYKSVGAEKIVKWEACLSIPGLAAKVERFLSIHLKATGWDGESFYDIDKIIHGYEARVLQHEIDHLQGILYVLKRISPSSLSYIEALET